MAKKGLTGFLNWLAFILLIVGGLNWGLAIFQFNLVTAIFHGSFYWLAYVVYTLVALSAIYAIAGIPKMGKHL